MSSAAFAGPVLSPQSRQALFTRPAFRGLGEAERERIVGLFRETSLAKGETIYNYPARLRHKNGSVQNVLISSSVLFDDAGNFVHTRCFTVLAPASSGK